MQNGTITLVRKLLAGAAVSTLIAATPAPVHATAFDVLPLVTNDQAANPASITDPNLVNAWGVSYPPTGPFWVSDNGAGVSTLYNVNPSTNAVTKQALTVSIPGNGSVTGQAFNTGAGSGAFNGDNFLFVSEDGTVSGWRNALGTTAQVLQPGSSANVYKGATVGSVAGNTYLYAANFRNGSIDVLKGDPAAPTLPGTFTDPNLPAGYAPFNVNRIGDTLYVTYAKQDDAKRDDVPGAGFGFVDAYDLNGNFLRRVASAGTLDSPWGLAVAPPSFGSFAGDLLVGNFGDGTISAFSLGSNSFAGQLTNPDGTPLVIDGLWGLIPGNGVGAGSAGDIYFTAGPDEESNGLFGAIMAIPEPASVGLLLLGLGALIHLRRRS